MLRIGMRIQSSQLKPLVKTRGFFLLLFLFFCKAWTPPWSTRAPLCWALCRCRAERLFLLRRADNLNKNRSHGQMGEYKDTARPCRSAQPAAARRQSERCQFYRRRHGKGEL